MTDTIPQATRDAVEQYEAETKPVLYALRELVLEVARDTEAIGPLTETLKWGEPSFLTPKTKSGTTLRIAQTRADKKPAIFVNCRTDLVDQFKQHYGDLFEYDGTRGLILQNIDSDNINQIKHCISLVLTYHARK